MQWDSTCWRLLIACCRFDTSRSATPTAACRPFGAYAIVFFHCSSAWKSQFPVWIDSTRLMGIHSARSQHILLVVKVKIHEPFDAVVDGRWFHVRLVFAIIAVHLTPHSADAQSGNRCWPSIRKLNWNINTCQVDSRCSTLAIIKPPSEFVYCA